MKLSNCLVLMGLSISLSACNQNSSNAQNDPLSPNIHSSPINCSNTPSAECQPELVRAPIPAKIRKILSPEINTSTVLFPNDIIVFDWLSPDHKHHQSHNQSYTIAASLSSSPNNTNSDLTLFSRTCPATQQPPISQTRDVAPQTKCSEQYLVQCIYMPNNQNQLLCETRTPALESQSLHWLINLDHIISRIPQTMHIHFKTCNNATCNHQSAPVHFH